MNKVWVLLTGSLRNNETSLAKLHFIKSLKEQGLIENFVFSTWKGEVNKSMDFSNLLQEFGGILVQSEPPQLVARGSYLHQILQLENGLRYIPDDAFVVKMRTDKCESVDGFEEENLRDLLSNKNYAYPLTKKYKDILEYRIGVKAEGSERSTYVPVLFFVIDKWYVAYKKDLMKIINYDVMSFDYLNLIPEQVLYASYFMQHWSIIKYFFQGINQAATIDRLLFDAIGNGRDYEVDALTEELLQNPVFIDGFLVERFLLNEFFYDIDNQLPIALNTTYRGIELNSDNRLDTLKNPHNPTYDRGSVVQLQDYLFKAAGIPKLWNDTVTHRGNLTIVDIASPRLNHLSITS